MRYTTSSQTLMTLFEQHRVHIIQDPVQVQHEESISVL